MAQQNMQFSEEKSRKSADLFSRVPFGVGNFPQAGADFFNWGAFSQPLIWGVIQGVWPIVLAALAADILPFLYLYFVPEAASIQIRVFLGYVIVQQLTNGIMRIWAGINANKLLWQRESFLIENISGKSRFSLQQFIGRQLKWGKYGLIALTAQYIISIGINYSQLEAAGTLPALIVSLVIIVWFTAVIVGARRIAMTMPVRMGFWPGSLAFKVRQASDSNIPQIFQPGKPGIVGIGLPAIGFGTYKIPDGQVAKQAVLDALAAGYRHIDTASFYGNEASIGEAIRESGIPREEIFITTKIWNDQQGYAKTVIACEESLVKLGVEYVDLLLLHWPIKNKMHASWKALEHLREINKSRYIGVCNFEIDHLEMLCEKSKVPPFVNQIELHPFFQRTELAEYCLSKHVLIEAWAPLMRGGVVEVPELLAIGERHKKTASQVAIRWSMQRGFVPLPKSEQASRIRENFEVFDFELTQEEMDTINLLDSGMRIGPDPATFSWEWPKRMKR